MEYGTPTKGQLEKINKLAKRPLSQEEVFVFPDKMCGDMIIPNRFIQLHKSLLQIFKQDAQNGVAFMLGHPWTFFSPKPAYNYGRTFDAQLKKSDVEGEDWALYGDHYIVRGREKDGVSTDQIIADIEDGVLFDTSIGWGANTFECSICGKDIRRWRECEHLPGRYYDTDDGQKLCWAIAKPPGYLMENSGVFDGAYPGAGILSQDGTIEGEGDMVIVDNLKQLKDHGIPLLHIYSAGKNRLVTFAKRDDLERKETLVVTGVISSANINTGGGKKMDEKVTKMLESFAISYKEGETQPLDVINALAEKWDKKVKEIQDSAAPLAQLDSTPEFLTKEKAVEVLGKELSADKILALAKEGQQHRESLITDALEWGVRALGNDFPADSYRQMLSEEGRTVQAIQDMRDVWKKQAEAEIPGDRQTDPGANTQSQSTKNEIPDEAYKA